MSADSSRRVSNVVVDGLRVPQLLLHRRGAAAIREVMGGEGYAGSPAVTDVCAAVEAAAVEARKRVRPNEGR
jgi:hypothetical protein